MPVPINEGLVTRGLAGLFGLKGRYRLVIDETEVPVVITSQFDRSPFQLTKPVGGALSQPNVALENSYVSCSPSPGVILCIDSILIDTATASTFFVTRLTAANFTTLGAPLNIQFMRDFNAIEPPQPNGPRTASIIEARSFIGTLGDVFARVRVGGGQNEPFVFPDGYFLHGDDPAGIDGVAVVSANLNISMGATFFCREFRLPG